MVRNNEKQFYTENRRENARVEDGIQALRIITSSMTTLTAFLGNTVTQRWSLDTRIRRNGRWRG